MQSNIFVKVAPLLKEKKFNIDCDAFVGFMGKYKSKNWIYPDALYRELSVDIKSIYDALEFCAEYGALEQYLQIYCPYCQRFTGNYYKTILEIPDFVNCVHCDNEITNPLQHAIIIYRML